MEKKSSKPVRHLGHGLHIQEGIHVTGQIENTGNKNYAVEAQSLRRGRRDENSAKSALYTQKCAKDG
jgi:hypothetical protein